MKKAVLFTCLLWAACQGFAQNFSCGLDTMRDVQKAIDMQQQFRENLFNFNVNHFRDSNPIEILPTPFPPPGCSGCLMSGPSCFRANFVISVIVHVVHDPLHTTIGANSNISVSMINDQIKLLNEQFANYNNTTTGSVNTGIQFCLAPVGTNSDGIFRYGDTLTNTNTSVPEFNKLADLINQTLYPTDRYMHIFVVSSLNKGGGKNFAGFAAHPTLSGPYQHGIVVRYQFFGDYAAYPSVCSSISEGKTLAHEVGHYLGLYHTFEGGCSGLTSTTCKKEGDLCCETPPVNAQQFGCSNNNSCTTDIPDKPDMITNHMAYNSDACRNMFTKDQVEIMYNTLLNIRSKLIEVSHLNALNLPCCVNSAMFSADATFHCAGGITVFTGLAYNSSTKYRWIITLNGSTELDVTNTGNNILSYNFTALGNYNVKLIIIEGTDTISNEKINYISVVNCGSAIKSDNGTWFFGNRGGLTFYSLGTAPNLKAFTGGSIDGPSIFSNETAVSQCDKNGRLLFLAGGQGGSKENLYVWDRNHNKFPSVKTTPLKGSWDCMNGLIVIPHSTEGKKFLLVSVTNGGDTGYMYYRVIDTTLNGNLGEVSGRANIPVKVPNGSLLNSDTAVCVKEPITAARGCDSSYFWLIAMDGGRYNQNARDSSFLVFKVKEDSIIFSHSYKTKHFYPYGNLLEFSPDGTKLVFGSVVYNFDKKTGQISEYLDFTENTDPVFYSQYPDTSNWFVKQEIRKYRNIVYSVSFSPNSQLLYFIRRPYYGITNSVFDTLFQMDLFKSEPAKFLKAVYSIPPGGITTFQMGPDNKIYVNRNGTGRFAVINSPDSLNTDNNPNKCGFSFNGVKIGGNSLSLMPNMIDTKKDTAVKKEILFTIKNCREYSFSTNICCSNTYTWKFGDNSTASGRTANHTYATEDTFTVKLLFDTDSIVKTIKVGGMTTDINGRTIGCDVTQPSEYYCLPRNSQYDYNWLAVGGNLLASNPIQDMPISWNTSGKVIVAVTDRVTGCMARDTMDVTKQASITNNTITNDTFFCQGGSVLISGSTPSGGGGGFTYTWYKSTDGSLWTFVPDSIRKHLLNKEPASLSYYREVSSNGCTSNSNISRTAELYIAANSIVLNKDVCFNGGKARLSGYGLNTNGNHFNYYWQYSTDNANWSNDPVYNGYSGTDTSKLNRYIVTINSKLYFRRKIEVMGCIDYSNVVSTQSPNSIRRHPLPAYVCHLYSGGNANYKSNIRINRYNSASMTFEWEVEDIGGNWISLPTVGGTPIDSTVVGSNTFSPSFTPGSSTFIRCKIIACGDTILSNIASLTFTTGNPTFSQTPSDAFAPPGQKGKFVAKSNNSGIQWQKSTDNGQTWSDMPFADDSVLLWRFR